MDGLFSFALVLLLVLVSISLFARVSAGNLCLNIRKRQVHYFYPHFKLQCRCGIHFYYQGKFNDSMQYVRKRFNTILPIVDIKSSSEWNATSDKQQYCDIGDSDGPFFFKFREILIIIYFTDSYWGKIMFLDRG